MLSSSAQKVQASLISGGFACEVVELPTSTHTAKEAAEAIGCSLAQIAKSLVFKTQRTGRPILVITSGVNRVNESTLGDVLGEPVVKADAAFVRERTGFGIGGVPPLVHSEPIMTLLDGSSAVPRDLGRRRKPHRHLSTNARRAEDHEQRPLDRRPLTDTSAA